MSWEVDKSESLDCPCGKGHFTVKHLSDDWGRFEERWEMGCSICNSNYELYTHHQTHKGFTTVIHGWVQKNMLDSYIKSKNTLEKEKAILSSYLEEHFGDKWIQHFKGKTKKAIWSELTQDGQSYPGLSTFYDHVHSSSLESVLRNYLNYSEIETLIRILELNDIGITSKIEKILKLERLFDEKEKTIRQQAIASRTIKED